MHSMKCHRRDACWLELTGIRALSEKILVSEVKNISALI